MAQPISPRRGGVHPIYGVFIGGGELDDTYRLTGTRHYKFTTQRRSAKVVNSIEQALLKAIDAKDVSKFNGNLETTPSTTEYELDKESFVKQLRKKVRLHGQQSFFTITYQDQVLNLFEHYHKLTVEEVIEQYELRCDEPAPENDPVTLQETETSKQLRFEAYDDYEFDDFGLSRLVVESLISPDLLERITTKYGNDQLYESYPGQVLFMMALDTCNASVQRDIAGAQVRYDKLTLDSYPGENVTELATEALRLIHILAGSYALPLTLGTTLIKKVTNTSSEFFNRKMFMLLDEARTLESKYKLLDPAAMGKDALFTTYGPYAICAALQEQHGRLLSDSDWPALATKLPESNTATATNDTPLPPSTSTSTVQCYKCKQYGHKANNPICSLYTQKRESHQPAVGNKMRPKDPWKYIEPKDLTTPVIIDNHKWFFCTKCQCRATGKLGYYQLSHTNDSHDPNWKPEGNLTPIEDPDPVPSPPLRPPSDQQHMDDDLVFTGVNCAPVVVTQATSRVEREKHDYYPNTLDSWRHSTGITHTINVSSVRDKKASKHADANCAFLGELWTKNTNTGVLGAVGSSSSRWLRTTENINCIRVYLFTYILSLAVQVLRYLQYACRVGEQVFLLLLSIAWDVGVWLKYHFLLITSVWWYSMRVHRTEYKRPTKLIRVGFPAKWLIFSAVMFYPQFWNGNFLAITPYFNGFVTSCITRHLSVKRIVRDERCTWEFLRDYNYENWSNHVYNSKVCNSSYNISPNKLSSLTSNNQYKKLTEEMENYYDAIAQPDDSSNYYFDAVEKETHSLQFDLHLSKHHYVNTTLNTTPVSGTQVCTAPMVSAKGGLELLREQDLEVNLTMQDKMPVILDTGASLAITGNKHDFLPNTYQELHDLKLGGMASGTKIEGVGDVSWQFSCDNGDKMSIINKCYYVPSAKTRLLSPQKIFDKQNGQHGKFWGDEDTFHLEYTGKPRITVNYSVESNLPIGYVSTQPDSQDNQVNLTILDEENQNLTAGQKLLLEYHYRFGHTNMPLVQQILRSEGFSAGKFAAASKCQVPKCSICEYAKAHRKPTRGQTHTPNPARDGHLKVNDLRPGSTISVDHFESRLKGRTYDSFGKATSDQYIGGCIFVDHSSGFVHVEFQLGFSAIETIRAKQNFEKFSFNNGVIPLTYLTDSGAFKANKFVQHIRDNNQKIQYCGTNAHHQNGVAE